MCWTGARLTEQLSPRAAPLSARPKIVIRASNGWGRLQLGDLWRFRELLWFLTLRDIKARHRQSALGPLWFILKPLINMVIFSFVFGRLANLPSEGIPYPIFTYTALIPWTYFQSATTMAVSSLVQRMEIISKIYFPRLLIPVSAVLSNLVDLAMSLAVLVGMMLFYDVPFRPALLTLPLFVLFAAAVGLAVGLWGATLAVKYRDVVLGVTFALQAWMFLTPVAYSATLVEGRWQWLYQANPMYWVIEGWRWAVLGAGQPPTPAMLAPLAVVLLLLVAGAYIFRRSERSIVDLL